MQDDDVPRPHKRRRIEEKKVIQQPRYVDTMWWVWQQMVRTSFRRPTDCALSRFIYRCDKRLFELIRTYLQHSVVEMVKIKAERVLLSPGFTGINLPAMDVVLTMKIMIDMLHSPSAHELQRIYRKRRWGKTSIAIAAAVAEAQMALPGKVALVAHGQRNVDAIKQRLVPFESTFKRPLRVCIDAHAVSSETRIAIVDEPDLVWLPALESVLTHWPKIGIGTPIGP